MKPVNILINIQYPLATLCGIALVLAILWYASRLNKIERHSESRSLLITTGMACVSYLISVLFTLPVLLTNYSDKIYLLLEKHFDLLYNINSWSFRVFQISMLLSAVVFVIFSVKHSGKKSINPAGGTSGAQT